MFPKTVLTLLAIGALSVNALSIPVARSPAPEPESQDLEARTVARVATGLSLVAAAAPLAAMFQKDAPKRELKIQELEARIHPLVIPAVGLAGTVGPMIKSAMSKRAQHPPKPKREPEIQELEARIHPLIIPGVSLIGAVAPMIKSSMSKRELEGDLFLRELEY